MPQHHFRISTQPRVYKLVGPSVPPPIWGGGISEQIDLKQSLHFLLLLLNSIWGVRRQCLFVRECQLSDSSKELPVQPKLTTDWNTQSHSRRAWYHRHRHPLHRHLHRRCHDDNPGHHHERKFSVTAVCVLPPARWSPLSRLGPSQTWWWQRW